MKDLSIYIHIPFCKSKCIYCDFKSFTDVDLKSQEKYLNYLIKEIEYNEVLIKNSNIKTIYIGGGTPSIVDYKYIKRILDKIRSFTSLNYLEEVTIEINPGTVDEEKLKKYKTLGINRLSFGLQSTHDQLLNFLGRIHNYKEFEKNYLLARKYGFDNISADLIFGLPGQDISMVRSSLDKLIELDIDHISLYSLKIEKGTKLFHLVKHNKVKETSEEYDREIYNFIINYLNKFDILQYEISNFSKKGYESKHNMTYWKHKDYLGLGLASHGFIEKCRYENVDNLKKYYELLDLNKLPIESKEKVTTEELLFERIILGLRLNEGINLKSIENEFNINLLEKYEGEINKLIDEKLLIKDKSSLKLTLKGRSLSNKVFVEFLS